MRNLHFRGLRRRLLRGGVAPKYVNRTVKELRHHLADLEQKALVEGLSPKEAAVRAEEQIGSQERIIEEALARPELKSWAHQFPWGIYGLSPVAMLALTVVASVFGVFGLLELAEANSGLTPEVFANAISGRWWVRALLDGWILCVVYALPAVVAGGLCLHAAKREAPVLWPTVGAILVVYLGFSYDLHIAYPEGPDQLATISGGIGFGTGLFQSERVLRLLIPLVLVLGPYYWWHRMQQDSST